jgi:hypothetical protein
LKLPNVLRPCTSLYHFEKIEKKIIEDKAEYASGQDEDLPRLLFLKIRDKLLSRRAPSGVPNSPHTSDAAAF